MTATITSADIKINLAILKQIIHKFIMADSNLKLSGVEYERYKHKMELVGGIDHYSLDLKTMSKDPSKLHPVEDTYIQWYFVQTKSAYTYKEYKAKKALESHNQVAACWVSDVCLHEARDNVIVRGKVCIIIHSLYHIDFHICM